MQPRKPSIFSKAPKFIVYAFLLSLPVLFWLNRFDVYDWWRLRSYTPSLEVAAIAERTTMVSSSRRVFYANHPKIEDSENLRSTCKQDTFSIVLGCYIAGQGIYLYDVNDPRLSGVKEVTAAHEMLHAAYDRLSSKERKRVDEMLQSAFTAVQNQRVTDTIEQYRQKDPSIVANELHSILGTEIRDLPPELEDYYKQYFSNRAAVVAFSEQYEGEFTSRKQRITEYDAQLGSLKQQIDNSQSDLADQSAAIKQERSRLDSLIAAQNYAEYNKSVDGFNRQVAAYNRLANQTTQLIEQYNAVVAERNALAGEVNDLAKAIDTRPQGISTQ